MGGIYFAGFSGSITFPSCISGDVLPISKFVAALFSLPLYHSLPLWNSDADSDLDSHPVVQLFTWLSFPVAANAATLYKAFPEFSLFPAVQPSSTLSFSLSKKRQTLKNSLLACYLWKQLDSCQAGKYKIFTILDLELIWGDSSEDNNVRCPYIVKTFRYI